MRKRFHHSSLRCVDSWQQRIHSAAIRAVAVLTLFAALFFPSSAIAHTPENRVIYEVFVRNFSPEGTLKGVEAQIPRLKALGVDVIWLMPIYTPGVEGKWGTYSSPYAVRDYKGIDPDYGTPEDFRSLVKTIHDNGMEIWLDWVANHTSRDNVWTKSNPGFYGNSFTSPFGWNDVYQLDFSNNAMQDAMIDAMQYWVDQFDVDGFRCDYASGPTTEFWKKTTQRVLKNGKRVAWLAEDDSKPELVKNGSFDYNYAWYFHDRLLDFARGGNVDNLRRECLNLHNEDAYRGRSRMVYLSNHDVVQDKGGTEVTLFHKYLRPLTVLEFTVFGMPLIYNGQEIGYKSGSVSLAEKTPIDWSRPDNQTTELIRKLCNLKHTQPALNTGHTSATLINHTSTDPNVYVYERRQGSESVVVMLNFNDSQKTFTISGSLPGFTGKDIFTDKEGKMAAGESFTLPGQGYAVYVKEGQGGDIPVNPTPATHNIYIKDETGWDNLYLYAYVDDAPSIFGAWPGVKVSETETIGGVEYKVVRNVEATDVKQTLIANDNGDNLAYIEGTYSITGDVYLTVGSKGNNEVEDPKPAIYILDNTGWDNLYLYGWWNGAPELYGGWPGIKASDTVTIEGLSYNKIAFPENATIPSNLIFNNNDGLQFDGPTLDHVGSIYIKLENNTFILSDKPFPTYNIYIEDKTGWDRIFLYAYVDDAPSIFGAWPGKEVTDTETIDGVKYRVVRHVAPTDVEQTFIIHNNSGEQQDIEGLYAVNTHLYFTSKAAIDQIESQDNSEAEYYTLQGIRVFNPGKGIYICKKGNKVYKIVR